MNSEEIRKDLQSAVEEFKKECDAKTYDTPEKISAAMLGIIASSIPEISAQLAESRVSLRDQFAMAALQGMMAHGAYLDDDTEITAVAEDCYRYADAMMKERDSHEGS